MDKDIYGASDIARICRTSRQTVNRWLNRGELQGYRPTRTSDWRITRKELFRFMKANNILVHKVSQICTLATYTVNGNRYVVPSIGYKIKLWDFDFACIPGIVDNAKVSAKWTDDINVKPVQNRYYDLHYFFNTLIKRGFFPQFMEDSTIPKEAQEFVNRIVPAKYREGKYVHTRGRLLSNEEFLLPDTVLKTDPYFEEFRRKPKPKTKSKKEKDSSKGKTSVDTEYLYSIFMKYKT